MSIFKLLLAEIRYRKVNFAMSLLAVAIAVALFVAGPVLVDGYGRETQAELERLRQRVEEAKKRVDESEKAAAAEMARLADDTRKTQLKLGFNLAIVHRDTDLVPYLTTGMPTVDMPQEWVEVLAKDMSLTMVTHLVATLRSKITWEGREVVLDGYLPETTQSHMRHPAPMGYNVKPGTVLLGFLLASGRKVGETIEVLGKPFRVAGILPEQGSREDTTIAMHLSDAQALLEKDKPPRINQILAIDCRCAAADLDKIRKQLEGILPETYVIRDLSKATARAEQRAAVQKTHEAILARQRRDLEARQQDLAETAARREQIQRNMETLAAAVTALVVVAAAAWVGLLALANVRERVAEIGVLRALGKGSGQIAALFLGKAVLLGLLGAAAGFLAGAGAGFLLGTDAPRWLGVEPLYAAAEHFRFPYPMLGFALIGAPLLSAVASYLPTLAAVRQDPAVVLRDH